MGPICFKESSFPKEFEPMCWETMFYVSMGNLGLVASCLQASSRSLGSLLERTMLWANLSQATMFPRGFECICPKESHILRKLEPICLWEVASPFPPRELGETWLNPLLPKETASLWLLRKTCLKKLLKSYICSQRCLWKKMKIWEKKIKPLCLNMMILTIAP